MNNKGLIVRFVLLFFLTSIASANSFATPAMDWRGAYVGGFIGGAASTHVTTTEPIRLDNNAYWFRPFSNSFNYDTNPSVIAGGTLGYNWRIGTTPYLIGVEGEYGYIQETGSQVDPNQYPYANLPGHNLVNTSKATINIGDNMGYVLLGGRLGYMQNRALFYLKAGAVFTATRATYISTKTEDMQPAYLNLAGTNHETGYGVGAGVEYALPFEGFSKFFVKVEYLLLDIPKTEYVYGHCSCHFLWRMTEHLSGINTLKVGLNYKFG